MERAIRKVETFHQQDRSFHDFISHFEDNLADLTYSSHEESQWKTMLERQLSKELRNLLSSASNTPIEYNESVDYLRKKDANIQLIIAPIQAFHRPRQFVTPAPTLSTFRTPNMPTASELTASLVGSRGFKKLFRSKDNPEVG